jgi:hypothetical protein
MTRYLIETKLADGTLVDTIATAEGEAERDKILAELEAERETDTHGAIVGTVTVTPQQAFADLPYDEQHRRIAKALTDAGLNAEVSDQGSGLIAAKVTITDPDRYLLVTFQPTLPGVTHVKGAWYIVSKPAGRLVQHGITDPEDLVGIAAFVKGFVTTAAAVPVSEIERAYRSRTAEPWPNAEAVAQLQPQAPRRTILLHLNIAAHVSDTRDATDIAESFLAHSDAQTLIEALTLAEEV